MDGVGQGTAGTAHANVNVDQPGTPYSTQGPVGTKWRGGIVVLNAVWSGHGRWFSQGPDPDHGPDRAEGEMIDYMSVVLPNLCVVISYSQTGG